MPSGSRASQIRLAGASQIFRVPAVRCSAFIVPSGRMWASLFPFAIMCSCLSTNGSGSYVLDEVGIYLAAFDRSAPRFAVASRSSKPASMQAGSRLRLETMPKMVPIGIVTPGRNLDAPPVRQIGLPRRVGRLRPACRRSYRGGMGQAALSCAIKWGGRVRWSWQQVPKTIRQRRPQTGLGVIALLGRSVRGHGGGNCSGWCCRRRTARRTGGW